MPRRRRISTLLFQPGLIFVVLTHELEHSCCGLGLSQGAVGGVPRLRLHPPSPSATTHALPSARTTGCPFRDHLAYQCGPDARWRM
jgi:hypothetical protein